MIVTMTPILHQLMLAWMVVFLFAVPQAVAVESERAKYRPVPLAELPVEIINNRVQLTMTAGETPLTLLLDTGATSSIYFQSEKLRAIAPEISGNATISFPAIGRSVIGQRIKTVTMRSGQFEFISRGGLLIGGDASVAAMLEAEYDVILGQEFFRAYTVEIDPAEKVLRLYEPGTNLSRYFATSQKLYMEGHTPHIRFFSRMPWETRPTSKAMLLDTGYPGSMVLWNKRHYQQATRFGQMVQKRENSAGIVSHINLKFADLSFENIAVFIASAIPNQAMKRDGLIGASILSQYRHVIDFDQEQLLMSPIYGSSGAPMQIMDGLVYTPNNENFDLKTFYPKVSVYPTLVIHSSGELGTK